MWKGVAFNRGIPKKVKCAGSDTKVGALNTDGREAISNLRRG